MGWMGTAKTLAMAASVFAAGYVWAAPQIEVFTPQGQAKSVRQVAVRFTEPMVAFGDPRLPEPFNVRCDGDPAQLKGRARWADPKNWVYDFDADLPAGQRCQFTLKPETKSAAGHAVEGRREFGFHTGGPAVMTSLPHEGEELIDEEQAFVLALDAPVDAASLSNAWCEAAGINERIPLQLLSEAQTRELLAANRDDAFNLLRLYFKGPRGLSIASFKIEDQRFKDLPVVAVRCARRLPAGANVGLVLGEEVKSKTGLARGTPQRLAFKVRPAFVVSLNCQRVNQDAACLPVTSMTLRFNAPVLRDTARGVRLKSENGKTWEPVLDANVSTVESVDFKAPFPEKTRFTVELPRDFRDDAGREADNKAAFPLATATDENPPLAKFPGRFGILELNAEPMLPVSVRGVEAVVAGRKAELNVAGSAPIGGRVPVPGRAVRIVDDEARVIERYRAFLNNDDTVRAALKRDVREGEVSVLRTADKANSFELPTSGAGKPLEVIGIPLPKPGFYIVELASPRLGRALHGEERPYYVSTSVLVTNLAVHLKHGRDSSLVWVTTLDHGKPVAGARVSVRDCTGKAWFDGTTDADGIAQAGDKLPGFETVADCKGYRRELFAFARVGEDMSFTSSAWNQGIQPWNFNLRSETYRRRPLAIHTVFDRTLFRAGETVSMKHIARVATGAGFRFPEAAEQPGSMEIEHLGSGQKFKMTVSFDAQGVAESVWKIPPEAKLGTYHVAWPGREIQSNAEFRVEAFRVPLMRAVLAAPKQPLLRPSSAKLDAAVSYLSGGPAGGQPVKVRYRVEARSVSFADYADFSFGGKLPKPGIQTGPAVDAWATFDADSGRDESAADEIDASPTAARALTLDAAGTATVAIDKLPPIDRPASLVVEMEYSDPNGEVLAVATRVPLHPAGVYLGIKPEGWAGNGNGVRAQVVALDPSGKPLAGRAVTVDIYEIKTYSNRRRVLGGFYAYDSTSETRRVGSGCSGTTDARGLMFCAVKPGASGELVLAARATDDGGREAYATASVWARGDGEWWFEPVNNDRIDLIPEKKRYEPGETAKFQVRMPFRSATVLVTVEREGVLSQQVVTLDGKSPLIEVPIAGSYGPNVFVSALAVRGRVDPEVPGPYAWLKRIFYRVGYWLGLVDEVPVERDTRPTALVDLARPAYKLGMAEIRVGRRDYELNVKVTPARDTYRVRETARVAIEVTDAAGKPAADGEIALAAVDEGLLELMDNASWNVLDALLGQRPVEVLTATAQGQVIGKRHFGKKALPPGGGGGRGGARELFDTLLVWKARVALDALGRATVDIPLNDALTGFRIVAVAQAGAGKFGDGRATVRTTQDLMLLSGLPPVVREQDDFSALFTLRNTTAQPAAVQLTWAVRDRPGSDGKPLASGIESVALAASEAKAVALPMKVPVGSERLYWEVSAAGKEGARDALRVNQKVIEVHPVRVYQATLAQFDKPLEFPVERPAGSVPGRGGVRVDVMGTLAGEMSAVREYFVRYPYTCLEQRTSKAIGLGDDALWQAVSAAVPNYLDRDGLARYFPSDWLAGSDALTAYLIQIADDAGRTWPEESLNRMLAGLEAYASGRIVRGSALPTADLTVRRLAAIEALSRHNRAKPALLDTISIDPALWPTSALIDWIGILKRVPTIARRDERLKEALGLLRARLNFQGTTMTFSTERSDALWWLMVSADVNANRALLAVLDQPEWRADVGRLVRGSLSRQKRGHWGTTVANAWGTVAFERYARDFEKAPAAGNTVVSLNGKSATLKTGAAKETQDFDWPGARETLKLAFSGSGSPWAIVQSRAALPLTAPLASGYAIKRTITAVEQKDSSGYTRGDVYRVTLDVDAQTDMTWVVIDDPIPSGAAILGSGLGRDAGSLARGEKREGWAWPAYIERTFDAYRAYYEFVPKGHFKIEYTVRLNNPGRFELPATRVEALYSPEMFGAVPNAAVAVKP